MKVRDGDLISLATVNLPLVLDGVDDVRLLGPATLSWSEHSSPILIRNCNRITIDGLTLIGPGPLTIVNKCYYAAIELAGVNDRITFRRCEFSDWGNHGVAHLTGDRTTTNALVERCRFSHGGNYGRTDSLVWDGAAVAIGGLGTTINDTKVSNWTRGFEFENANSDCYFTVDGCQISNCPHVGVWITPTGGQNGIKGQVFSGRITNTTIGPGRKLPTGFLPTGICCTGGQDIQVLNFRVFGMQDGCGVMFSATMAPIKRVQICNGLITDIGRSGILYRNGFEGTKDKVDDLVCSGNLLTGIMGTPLDIEPGIRYVPSGNLVV